jgi:hypothetical protein
VLEEENSDEICNYFSAYFTGEAPFTVSTAYAFITSI